MVNHPNRSTALFQVSLTNPDDQATIRGLSYTSGRFGFTIRADTMGEAIALTVTRAKTDEFYGYDWSAKINKLSRHRQTTMSSMDGENESIVGLYDQAKSEWLDLYGETAESVPPLHGGGVRLW